MENINEVGNSNILLESGTNEIEVMEFTISGEVFGINVAKVTEIMMAQQVKNMPNSHECVEGVFKPRDDIITVIDLGKYLNLPEFEKTGHDIFVVTYFNKLRFAFHVETVVGINRISWGQIKKTDSAIYGGNEGVATGIVDYNGRLITILDFEKIVAEIDPESAIKVEDISKLGKRKEIDKTILIAEDSALLSKMILECLHKSGYTKTIVTSNGQEAWDYLKNNTDDSKDITNQISCIITDIEMPLMDGHRLTRLVKQDDFLNDIPIVIFSSLISEEMKIKGEMLGANEQISKPQIEKLISVIDNLTVK